MLPDQREALDMIFHKIGRIVCGDPNYADSWHDIAGYAKLVENRLNGKSERGVAQTEAAVGEWRNDRPPTKEDAGPDGAVWTWSPIHEKARRDSFLSVKVLGWPWVDGNLAVPTYPPAEG